MPDVQTTEEDGKGTPTVKKSNEMKINVYT